MYGNWLNRWGHGMPSIPPACAVRAVPLQRLSGDTPHLRCFKYDMIFERPHNHSKLSQTLVHQSVPLDGSRLVVAIPIDHIGFPSTCRLYDLPDLIAATPLKRDSIMGE
jgi:hypothetical protein